MFALVSIAALFASITTPSIDRSRLIQIIPAMNVPITARDANVRV